MDGEARMDPSSISLFSTATTSSIGPVDEHTRSSAPDEDAQRPSSSISQAVYGPDEPMDGVDKEVKFSAYKRKKNLEVVRRRNLIDRLDKLKDSHGVTFTIPQLKTATNNQLSIFLRRLRKSSDIKHYLSTELLNKIFVAEEEEDKEELVKTAKVQTTQGGTEQRQTDKFSIGRLGGAETQPFLVERLEDDAVTDEEITDHEEDDIYGSADDLTLEKYELLEQEMQILAADARALNMQAEIKRQLKFVEEQFLALEHFEHFTFEQPMETGNVEEDSMSSIRCRTLLNRPKRELFWHDFESSRREQAGFRPIAPNKRCGTEDYAFADGSVHPQLSLPTSIPLDAQILKYLHVIDFVPGEIELRRLKTAKLMSARGGQDLMKHAFYNLEDELRDDQMDDRIGSAEARAIKISLPLHHKTANKKRDSNIHAARERGKDSSDTESDPNDWDYDDSSSREPMKLKRRRMTYSTAADRQGTSKPSKLETRRTSHADFGASMFNYDYSHVMDIGLPLPTIQKVENVEIVIPSFRKKTGLIVNSTSAAVGSCDRCQFGRMWADVERLHGDLEVQEKSLRFRPPLGSSSRKSTMTSTNNPMEGTSK